MRVDILCGMLASCVVGFGATAMGQAQKPARLGTSWLRHAETVNTIAFSPGGKLLASGGQDRYLKIWDLEKGRLVHQLCGDSAYGHYTLSFSPDGTRVVAGTGDGLVRLWKVSDGTLLWQKQRYREGKGPAKVEFFSKGDRIAVVGYSEGEIKILSATTGNVVLRSITILKSLLPGTAVY